MELIGKVIFANGEVFHYYNAKTFLDCVQSELLYRDTTGFRYEVLTDDIAVRKAVDDILYDLFGEENPRELADYVRLGDL